MNYMVFELCFFKKKNKMENMWKALWDTTHVLHKRSTIIFVYWLHFFTEKDKATQKLHLAWYHWKGKLKHIFQTIAIPLLLYCVICTYTLYSFKRVGLNRNNLAWTITPRDTEKDKATQKHNRKAKQHNTTQSFFKENWLPQFKWNLNPRNSAL